VVLSGYAKRVGPLTIAAFDGRMLNVHPAPLPEFGGQGMYGMAVHEAVLSSDRQETAVTIHQVNDRYDDGAIVASYSIPIHRDDSAEALRERVHDVEPDCWIDVLRRVMNGELLPDARAARTHPPLAEGALAIAELRHPDRAPGR
jgi:phosphoribosylglycinamide formyltransferase-1